MFCVSGIKLAQIGRNPLPESGRPSWALAEGGRTAGRLNIGTRVQGLPRALSVMAAAVPSRYSCVDGGGGSGDGGVGSGGEDGLSSSLHGFGDVWFTTQRRESRQPVQSRDKLTACPRRNLLH